MLKAHLDPEFDGASRKLDFIEKSVAWITERIPPADYPLLLDIGCGPGIYAELFTKKGYQLPEWFFKAFYRLCTTISFQQEAKYFIRVSKLFRNGFEQKF